MRNLFPFFLLAFFIINFATNGAASEISMGYLDQKANRTMVPLRFISEELGAKVAWESKQRIVTINKANKEIKIRIGENRASVNGKFENLDAKAVVKTGQTYVPIRFVSETLAVDVKWIGNESTVVIKEGNKVVKLYVLRGKPVTHQKANIKVGTKTLAANIVKVDLKHPGIQLKVGLAKGHVGQVEDLAQLAKRHKAIAAINGTFFDAYTAVKEPYGVIVVDGKPVHIGREKTVFGFDKNKNVFFDIVDPTIKGTINNSLAARDSWYAYWLNRTPSQNGSCIHLLTPERGSTVSFSYGTNVIVRNGVVTAIRKGNVSIPKDGYVINFIGNYEKTLLSRFQVGKTVDYEVEMHSKASNKEAWNEVEGALGAGPRLVTDGKVTVNPKAEGFTQDNILRHAGARSAVGVTKDHYLLLVTTTATMNDLGSLMKALGAVNAMNLDGGASSGLYYNGGYITRTGRQISNGLLILQQ